MMKKQLIAGNWKMNGTIAQAHEFLKAFVGSCKLVNNPGGENIVVCPPYTLLHVFAEAAKNSTFKVGAQDAYAQECGAFTGNINAPMLKDAGCEYVIVGHSERRTKNYESNFSVQKKAEALQNHGMVPILCIGETQKEREEGKTEEVLSKQIQFSLPLNSSVENLVIAYEPVWAIGTGLVPTNEEIVATIKGIRTSIEEVFNKEFAEGVKILYGGSVNGANASEILSLEGVDGVLVGGASLKAEEFAKIADSAKSS